MPPALYKLNLLIPTSSQQTPATYSHHHSIDSGNTETMRTEIKTQVALRKRNTMSATICTPERHGSRRWQVRLTS
jgi:hypothetical protein